jgi:hypothetical protein
LQICLFATNVKHAGEEPQTISVVTHAAAPGAPAYKKVKKAEKKKPHDVRCEVNKGRAKNPDEGPRQKYLLNLLGFSRIFAGIMVALPHRSGMFPFHVSSVSSALMDWMFMLVDEHVLCLFNVRVRESIGRIKVRIFLINHCRFVDIARTNMSISLTVCSKGTKAGTWWAECG